METIVRASEQELNANAASLAFVQNLDNFLEMAVDFLEKGLGWFFRGFNLAFARSSQNYSGSLTRVISGKSALMGAYVLLIGLTAVLFNQVPSGCVPGPY